MSHSSIKVSVPNKSIQATVKLVSSKSESNRALIINAVSGNKCTLHNLSEARDTQTMQRLLASNDVTLDVIDAGTTMRFLTAFTAISKRETIMTGTPRMCERPIGILAEALKSIGCDINYLQKEGFPPLSIKPYTGKLKNKITMQGDVSSQYISAVLMNAPLFEDGLIVELTGKIASRPYLDMTLVLMSHFGVQHQWVNNEIHIAGGQQYKVQEYTIESDWSGASYWYSIVALADENTSIELLGLKENSLQGDSVLVDIMQPLGVKSTFNERGVVLTKIPHQKEVSIDFTHCPDIAQTLSVVAAAKNIKLSLSGLESLRIKETDRIYAIQTELAKFGASMNEAEEGVFVVESDSFKIDNQIVDTYDDHRMAMAFAPLALVGEVIIEEPDVVKKSYPGYWNDLKSVGFSIINN